MKLHRKNNKYLLSRVSMIVLLIAYQINMAMAGTDTASMNVTTKATDACIISPPDSIDFGYISAQSSFPIWANFNIGVTCTKGTTYTITRNSGSSYSSSTQSRMTNGNSYIQYYFKYATSTSTWGTGEPLDGTNTGTGLLISHPARIRITYARYLDNVTLPGTMHTDTVIFTVNF